jgi:hypothetical protein
MSLRLLLMILGRVSIAFAPLAPVRLTFSFGRSLRTLLVYISIENSSEMLTDCQLRCDGMIGSRSFFFKYKKLTIRVVYLLRATSLKGPIYLNTKGGGWRGLEFRGGKLQTGCLGLATKTAWLMSEIFTSYIMRIRLLCRSSPIPHPH